MLRNNVIQGKLSCTLNTPAPTGAANVAIGGKYGQCTRVRPPRAELSRAPRSRPAQRRSAQPRCALSWSPSEILTIQLVPKRSTHIPKVSPHGCGASAISTRPPAESFSQ